MSEHRAAMKLTHIDTRTLTATTGTVERVRDREIELSEAKRLQAETLDALVDAVLNPPRCTCLGSQGGPDYCVIHAA